MNINLSGPKWTRLSVIMQSNPNEAVFRDSLVRKFVPGIIRVDLVREDMRYFLGETSNAEGKKME